MTTSCLGLGVPLPVVCALFRSRSASSSPSSLLISALALRSIPAAVSLDTFGVCPLRSCSHLRPSCRAPRGFLCGVRLLHQLGHLHYDGVVVVPHVYLSGDDLGQGVLRRGSPQHRRLLLSHRWGRGGQLLPPWRGARRSALCGGYQAPHLALHNFLSSPPLRRLTRYAYLYLSLPISTYLYL